MRRRTAWSSVAIRIRAEPPPAVCDCDEKSIEPAGLDGTSPNLDRNRRSFNTANPFTNNSVVTNKLINEKAIAGVARCC